MEHKRAIINSWGQNSNASYIDIKLDGIHLCGLMKFLDRLKYSFGGELREIGEGQNFQTFFLA